MVIFLLSLVLQPHMQSIVTSPQLQPVTIQHQRVLTPTGPTIQTLSTPTTVHTMQQQVQQVPVGKAHSCDLLLHLMSILTLRLNLFYCFSSGSSPATSDPKNRLAGPHNTQTRWDTGAVNHAEPHRDHHITHPEHCSTSPGIHTFDINIFICLSLGSICNLDVHKLESPKHVSGPTFKAEMVNILPFKWTLKQNSQLLCSDVEMQCGSCSLDSETKHTPFVRFSFQCATVMAVAFQTPPSGRK